MYESDDKMVSHPKHYMSESGLEVIDVIEAFTANLTGIEATDTGNIIKYACRWKQKGGVQDLKKIMWYTQHLIDYLEGEEDKKRDEQENAVDISTQVTNQVKRLLNGMSITGDTDKKLLKELGECLYDDVTNNAISFSQYLQNNKTKSFAIVDDEEEENE